MSVFFATLKEGVSLLFEVLELLLFKITLFALAVLGAYGLLKHHP
jgi:hypothetical protein